MQRRTLLAALSVAGGTAGCLAVEPPRRSADDGADPSDDGVDPSDDGEPIDDDPELGAGVSSAELVTTASHCGGPSEGHVHVLGRNGEVAVDGTIPAPTPCYAARLVSAAVNDGELALTIGVRSTLEQDESCAQCHGSIEYRSDLTLETDESVDAVTVTHDTGRIHRHERPAGEHADRASVETIETACASQLGAETVAVRVHDRGFRLDGVRPAPNPCHAATIESIELVDGVVSLVVGIEPTATDDEGCIECEGSVRYGMALRVDAPDTIAGITVDHEGSETHEIDANEFEGATSETT